MSPVCLVKVLILRDSVEALTRKRRHLGQLAQDQDYIETVRPIFDAIYSFDPADCERYNLRAIEQFLPFSWKEIEQFQNKIQLKIKAVFVGGYEPIRANVVRTLTPVLENCGYKTDFYLLDKYDNRITIPIIVKIKTELSGKY